MEMVNKIIEYLKKHGFVEYAKGYFLKGYGRFGKVVYNANDGKLIDRHTLNGVREYDVMYVKDIKRIMKDIGDCN